VGGGVIFYYLFYFRYLFSGIIIAAMTITALHGIMKELGLCDGVFLFIFGFVA
jgi:hypothetical protein